MKVEITRENILDGKRHRPYSCPVALALMDIEPTPNYSVGLRTIQISGPGGTFEAQTPPEVSRFVDLFDTFGPDAVQPFSFDLNGLQPVLNSPETNWGQPI